MPNIPRSPNGQFSCQPLNQTPNSRIPSSAPILDLPHVRIQRGSSDSGTPLNNEDLSNRIIDDDKEEESSIPLVADNPSNATLGEALRQLAIVTCQLATTSETT
ncbi:hypothetical protein PSTG_01485 [Puccinia striiformis f. sp. tritici PST-78]|uniref:Uncharacterized protein n=1 Tax=Puccinia striiformis f. sp. tritici PST-78 TaxID=1165861 RepID=A0A0L0W175_9BASI|nr:hypothetical protein PSTG_01485 [Puccinia striiformis f. sp. tritici PST-78]